MYFEACHVFLLDIKGLLLKEDGFSQRLIPVTKNENTEWIKADCKKTFTYRENIAAYILFPDETSRKPKGMYICKSS